MAGWKRLLLPLWNGGHRLGWRLGEYAGALRRGRFERCSVCGRYGPMLYRRWVIPAKLEAMWGLTPGLAEALARKESNECAGCGAKLRTRRLAEVVLALFRDGPEGGRAGSVREWVATSRAQGMAIAEINPIVGMHEELARLPGLAASDHHDPAATGVFDPETRHEDLTRLSYADAQFDLVLTSETLEHVPDLNAALGEIWRVLRPGGWHVFTVPLMPGVERTYARAQIGAGGEVEVLCPPLLHHPGGDTGYPVFTEFGADLPELLRGAGFEVDVWFGPTREEDIAQVFACRKPEGAAG